MNWVKIALDTIVSATNIFPSWKTKIGAVLQLVATALMGAVAFGIGIPMEYVLAVQTAASTFTAVGAANQPANNK